MNRVDLRGPHTHHGLFARVKTGLYAMTLAGLAYMAVVFVPPGLVTYLLTLPPVVIVLLTAWARINDLSIEMAGTVWNVRRSGLIFTSMFTCGVAVWPWLYGEWTPWLVVFGIWGFAKTWLTTPHQPPWKHYIRHDYKAPDPVHPQRRKEDDFDAHP